MKQKSGEGLVIRLQPGYGKRLYSLENLTKESLELIFYGVGILADDFDIDTDKMLGIGYREPLDELFQLGSELYHKCSQIPDELTISYDNIIKDYSEDKDYIVIREGMLLKAKKLSDISNKDLLDFFSGVGIDIMPNLDEDIIKVRGEMYRRLELLSEIDF